MRLAVLACAVGLAAGCSFDEGGFSEERDAAAKADAMARPDAARADAQQPPRPDATVVVPDDCPDDADLVACWRFEVDEHPSQPWDDSAYGNHGTAVNVSFIESMSGYALSVDATSSVKVPDSASLDVPATLTMELWLRARTLPAVNRAGLVDDNGQYGLFLTAAGEVRCAIASTTVTGLAVEVGKWTHLACVYDGVTVTLYQDGVAGASVFYSGAIATAPTDGIAIGQNSPSGDPLDGELDTVRIWRTPRTSDQLCEAARTCAARRE